MSTSGSLASQRPMSTFCWLPPESDLIWVLLEGVLMFIFRTFSCTRSSTFRLLIITPKSRYFRSEEIEMLSATLSTPMMPVLRRSSVSMATP